MTSRIGVLASGNGSNLQAILDYFAAQGAARAGGEIVLVASDRPDAGALERAREHGVTASVLATSRRPDGAALAQLLHAHAVDLVVLAGYLRKVPSDVVHRYAGKMLNIHPALLPSFGGSGMYGRRVHEAVLRAGVKVTGVTVHFVDEEYDRGPIVAQWPVPVLHGDDAAALAARVLRVEHALYPRVVSAIARGALRPGRSPAIAPNNADSFTLALSTDACLADAIDAFLAA